MVHNSQTQRLMNQIQKGLSMDGARIDPAWKSLTTGFPSQTEGMEVIYALPQALLAEVQRHVLGGFFSKEELDFEEALAADGRTGFFLGQSFRYSLLEVHGASSQNDMRPKQERDIDRRIDDLLLNEVRDSGGGECEVDHYVQSRDRLSREITARRRAYAGWLVTDPGFHVMRAHFRMRWKAEFERQDPRPSLPINLFLKKPAPPNKKALPFFLEFWRLCRHWSVQEFHSWELPEPIDAGILRPTLHSLDGLGDSECLFYIPWYLARDEKITLRDMLTPAALATNLSHLTPWLEHTPKNFGIGRYAIMLQMYVYLELALKSRYAARIRGKMPQLDLAIGRFLQQEHKETEPLDSIRKIRQFMQRRLKECKEASTEVLTRIKRRDLKRKRK